MDEKRIAIIDGNSLINRAYYAIRRPMITQEGIYTQGIYGFLSMLNKLRTDYEPSHMLVAWDLKGPTFRHEAFSDYKAGRAKMPPELAMQLPLLKEVLKAMNIPMYEREGYEADDIIGTVAKRSEEAGFSPIVFTGDKDALQLATDKTTVIITKKGISEFASYDDVTLKEEYGFDHLGFIDYKGLRGDPSDNIPGVPGVGEKTAIRLIKEFGSIEHLLERVEDIESQALQKRIRDNAPIALLSKKLATIHTGIPLPFSPEDCRILPPDTKALVQLYQKLEFRTHLKNLMVQMEGAAGGAEPSDVSQLEGARYLSDEGEIAAWLKARSDGESLAVDIRSDVNHVEVPSFEGLECLADDGCVILAGGQKTLGLLEATLKEKTFKLTGFNLQRLYYVLGSLGLDTQALTCHFDVNLAQYALAPNRSALSLDALLFENYPDAVRLAPAEGQQVEWFGQEDQEDAVRVSTKLSLLMKLADRMAKEIQEQGLEEVFYSIELPLVPILASMEREGISVDSSELEALGGALKEEIAQVEADIHQLAGEVFNVQSPMQLGEILFEKMKLPGAKKTKRGYGTGAEILEKLVDEHPIVERVLHFRMLAKLNSTYVEGLLPLIGWDGRIRAHFQQTVAATGRISCTEPNLQNIPIRQELGRQLRKAFIAQDHHLFVGADYSQIELRILAHMSADDALIEAFNKGLDIHRRTASRVLGVSEEDVTDAMRTDAKAINFGVIYGMGSFRLSQELGISRQQAQQYIDAYFQQYSAVKRFMDEQIQKARDQGYAETLFGRKRPIPEMRAGAFAVRQQGERLAMNTPIQGSAADIIKLAMIAVHEALRAHCPRSRLILQVHDELVIHAHQSEAEQVKALLIESMMGAAKLRVPLEVSLEEGENWYLLK